MSLIFAHRYVLVMPDGTEQELEWSPEVGQGDLISSNAVNISPAPNGKYIVTRVEEIKDVDSPHIKMYYLEKF